ncbi:CIA30 family protein [Rhodopseudomonas telluris]|uniref:CIA30 family protein n=1 Tax=Rhodopseudomonas telluris TaxID=644215 RepID=A0ABV6EU48_9BRAD
MTEHELWPDDGKRRWRLITDMVMGGVSRGTLHTPLAGERSAVRMRGAVSTDNNGGFIQIAMDLRPDGGAYDASAYAGIGLEVSGNGESYGVHLRTTDMVRPQQSYRQTFTASHHSTVLRLPFAEFVAHRIETPFDPARLRRVGLVAIGRAFDADLSVARLWLY